MIAGCESCGTTRSVAACGVAAVYTALATVWLMILQRLGGTLNTDRIRVRSRERFENEQLTSLVAYNLVVHFRREAAPAAASPATPEDDKVPEGPAKKQSLKSPEPATT